jgi:O-antigen/teichoic acid export membrane protein
MDRAVVSDVAGRAAAFGAVVAVSALDLGFYAVVVTAGIGALVTLCVTYALSRPLVRVSFSGDRIVWRELLVAALPLGLALAINEVYFRADTFIISLYRSYEDVGIYALAYRVLELLAVFPAVFMNSVFPLLSRYLAESAERARRTVDVAADVLVAVGLPLAAGGVAVAPHIVRLVGGHDFRDAADPLRLLLFAGALAFVSGLFGYALIAAGRQRAALWLNVVALAFNVGLNLALVPPLGVDAAAAIAIASEVVLLAGGYVLVRRHVGLSPRFALLPKALAAAAAMGAVLWLLRDWSLALLLPLGVAVYGGLLYALGGIDRRMLAELRT